MELAPPHPGHLGVEGLLREGVAERGPPGVALLDQAELDQLRQARLAARARRPGRGRAAGRRPPPPRPPRAPPRRASRWRRGPLRAPCRAGARRLRRRARARAARAQRVRAAAAPRPAPRRRTASPCVRSWTVRDQGGGGRLRQQRLEQRGDAVAVERVERDLLQARRRGAARCAASAGGGRGGGRRSGRRRSTRTGICRSGSARAASSSRVVSSDHCRSSRTTVSGCSAREVGEGAADRLEDRRPLALGRGLAQLGQQQGEVGEERPALVERLRVGAQPRAQGGDDRAVGDGRALGRGAAQDESGVGGRLFGEPALADAGLAAEQDDRAGALAGALDRLAEPGELGRPADERGPRRSSRVSLGRPCRRDENGPMGPESSRRRAQSG